MSSWKEYVDIARDRGSLAAEFFAVHTVPGEAASRIGEVLPRHLEYQKDLQDRRILVFAGPLSDVSGQFLSGEGLIIYRAATLTEADILAAADPMHAEGCRTYTLKRWLINEGHIPDELRPLDTA